MKDGTKAAIVYAFVSLLLVVIAVWHYSIKGSNASNQLTFVELPATPIINPDVNKKFFEKFFVNSSFELNKGLTIERMATVALEGIPTPSINHVSLLIKNHTEETITFTDIGFGAQVFQYTPESLSWSIVSLPYTPEKSQKTLPPETESFDYNALNTWEFNDEDFQDVNADIIRIFIKGEGINSQKIYAAYIDLILQK